MTGRNAMGKFNVSPLRSATDLSTLVFSPGAKGGLAPLSIAVAPSASTLTVTLGAPTLPTGWTIAKAIAVAIQDQDPQTDAFYNSFVADDASAPYAPAITGLVTGTLYRVGAYFQYTKPDGTTAYGTALTGTGTPT